MTIKTDVKKVEKDTVVITIEVPAEQIAGPINKSYREIAKKVRIPGFRRGKAPKPIIDQMVGKEVVLDEAANDMIPDIYSEAVKDSGVIPVTMPEIEVVQIKENEPLIFTAKVQVKPEIKLGSLDDLEIEPMEQASLADEVDSELEKLRNKFATLDVVKSRESRKGDFVLIDYEGFIDNRPFEGGRGSDYMLELGAGTFIPGFEDQLIGAKPGASKDVELTFPEKYESEHLAGADAVFKVKIKEIKTKKLPKLDDEFAVGVSKFDTLKELKGDLKAKAKEQQEKQKKAAVREGALTKMAELAELDLPDGMVERRIDQMVEAFANQVKQIKGGSFEDWLSQTGMEPKEFRNNYKQEAIKNLKTEMTLEAVAKEHGQEATDEDIDEEIKRLAEGADRDVDELKAEIEERDGYDFLRERLSMDKAIDFLADKAKIKAKKKEKKDDADESSTDSN